MDDKHRGIGLGKVMVENLLSNGKIKGLKGMLITKDAFKLYEKFGFKKDAEMFMKTW